MPATTITQQINIGRNLVVTDKSFHAQRLISIDADTAMILNVDNLFSQYRNEMKKYINRYTLSDRDIKKYAFKPELLCFDIYGTIELVPFLLRINNMVSVTEFSGDRLSNGLNMFSGGIFDFFNEILIKEKTTITTAKDNLEKDLST
jgi:hypothetical protein